MHKDLQYTVLEPSFASIYSVSGEAYGFFFTNNTQTIFESLLTFNLEDNLTNTEKAMYETSNLYCITYSSVKKSNNFYRGAKIMGIAAVTKSNYFYALKPILALALNHIFENLDNIGKILRRLYRCINKTS